MDQQLPARLSPEEFQQLRETSDLLVKTLKETTKPAQIRLWQIIRALGNNQALTLLKEVNTIETNGGLLTNDHSRRRTMGGTYFYLARQRLQDHPDYHRIFPNKRKITGPFTPLPMATLATPAPPEPIIDSFEWTKRQDTINHTLQETGRSSTMKVTLVGRPGKIVDKGAFIVTAMPTMKVPALPKGIPTPSEATQTQILVYVAQKQWKKVAEAIQDPEDALIIEGFAIYEPQIKGMAILTSNITTKALQRNKSAKPTTTSEDQ